MKVKVSLAIMLAVVFGSAVLCPRAFCEEKKMGDEVKSALKDLKSQDVNARINAAAKLGERQNRDPRALPDLLNALKDDNAIVRQNAADTIGNFRDKSATGPLVEALKKETDNSVKVSIIVALNYVKDKECIVPLVEIFQKEKTENIRINIIQLFGSFRAEQAVQELIKSLGKDKSSRIRAGSARALGFIASPLAVKPLIKALEDTDETVVMNAIEALGTAGDRSAAESIKPLLGSKNARLKCIAAAALGKLGSADGFAVALGEAGNADPKVRVAAIEALGNMGKSDEAVIKAIAKALEDTDRSVVRVAETARINLGIIPEQVAPQEQPQKEQKIQPAVKEKKQGR